MKANISCNVWPKMGMVDWGRGEIFHVVNNGMTNAERIMGPNELRMMNAGEKGYVTDSKPTKAAFHWIDDKTA